MASIPLTPKTKQILLKLKDDLGEKTQTGTLERIINDFEEMRIKYKSLHWLNELNKNQGTKNAIEIN